WHRQHRTRRPLACGARVGVWHVRCSLTGHTGREYGRLSPRYGRSIIPIRWEAACISSSRSAAVEGGCREPSAPREGLVVDVTGSTPPEADPREARGGRKPRARVRRLHEEPARLALPA